MGNHRVTGAVVPLPKPCLLLQKRVRPAEEGAAEGTGPDTAYVVRAVIRRKLLFTDRPQPIIGTVANGLVAGKLEA